MITRSCAGLIAGLVLVHAAVAAQPGLPPLYRLFLQDGTTLVSYGEFARVADRVVMSIPLGDADGSRLELVSIPEALVDWERTDEYTTAVRARHFASTYGPDHFALLGARVTEALNLIRLTPDPARQLAMAEEARRNLLRWPRENFGYRADDVARMGELFDEVISELRIAAGQPGFDLRLSANTAPPEYVPLQPAPSARESYEQALMVARLSADPAERLSLMQAIEASLRDPARSGGWAAGLHARVAADLAAETRIERQYQDLVARTTRLAQARAAQADVRGLQALVRGTLETDDRLGRRRPHVISALLAFVDVQLVAARELRLARQAWSARRALFEEYRHRIASPLDQLRQSRGWLTAVRDGRPLTIATLEREEQRTVMARRVFELVPPPAELDAAQSLYVAAFHMTRRAAAGLRDALVSGESGRARDASAAASGALLLLEQADGEIARVLASPER